METRCRVLALCDTLLRRGDLAQPMDFSARAERYASTFEENEELLGWLRKEQPEEVLEPELPICDPHRACHIYTPAAATTATATGYVPPNV